MDNIRKWTVSPQLSNYLFWDVDRNKVDFTQNANFVVRRVFELGTIDDISEVLSHYHQSFIVESLTSAPSLKENAMSLASILFKIPFSNFKCYISTPFQTTS